MSDDTKSAVFSPEWLKARLSRRGDQKRLADHIGLSSDQMSKVVKGERMLKGQEVVRALQFLGESQRLTVPADRTAQGFSEGAAKTYELPDGAQARLRTSIAEPAAFQLQEPAPWLGLLIDDCAVIDRSAQPKPGETVIVQIEDTRYGWKIVCARLFLPPWMARTSGSRNGRHTHSVSRRRRARNGGARPRARGLPRARFAARLTKSSENSI